MSQRIQTNKTKRRRGFTYLWILCLAAVVFILIYKEWTEVLYILATVGVTALLVVVAAADIGHAAPSAGGPAELADAQATSSGVASKVSAQKSSAQSE
jgi:endonuclease/exonuclease/phosphatase (EEP) superfamily protein YafD